MHILLWNIVRVSITIMWRENINKYLHTASLHLHVTSLFCLLRLYVLFYSTVLPKMFLVRILVWSLIFSVQPDTKMFPFPSFLGLPWSRVAPVYIYLACNVASCILQCCKNSDKILVVIFSLQTKCWQLRTPLVLITWHLHHLDTFLSQPGLLTF